MKIIRLFFLLLLSISIYNCSNDSEDDLTENANEPGDVDNPDDTEVNYTDNISSIMQSSCVGCHASPPVNGAPFALINFAQVDQRASSILSRMDAGTMPPSGRLPQSTIDLVQQWIDNGKPEN